MIVRNISKTPCFPRRLHGKGLDQRCHYLKVVKEPGLSDCWDCDADSDEAEQSAVEEEQKAIRNMQAKDAAGDLIMVGNSPVNALRTKAF